MKKIITLLLVLTLLASMAVAQGKPEVTGAPEDAGQDVEPQQIMAQEQVQAQDGEGEQVRARNKEMLQTGLENALSRVKNENAKQRLQQNIEKFQEKFQERLQRMEGVEVEEVDEETGAVKVKAKEQVKFFGFIKGTATKRFEMDSKGNINEKAPWYRFLYAEVKEESE